VPIYEQLVYEIKQLAVLGLAEPDEKLPGVRQLSTELGINPNTVMKAYAQLEREGVIYTLAGKGSFITSDTASVGDGHRKELLKSLKNEAAKARDAGVSLEEAIAQLRTVYEGGNEL
jgi:GntR family transcriptional regulator